MVNLHVERPTSNVQRPTPPIGVLMLDTRFPRPPGDIGNPATFDFPVVYRVVERATPTRVVDAGAEGLIDVFCDAARELEAAGVGAITTSCGFLALHQQTLAAAVSVPVFTSSLLQVPLALAAVGPRRNVGVVTFKAEALTPAHFAAAGVPSLDRVRVVGLESAPAFYRPIAEDLPALDVAAAEREIVAIVAAWAASQPGLGALVLECTNLPPYSATIQAATGLPVWDIVTLVHWANEGDRRQESGEAPITNPHPNPLPKGRGSFIGPTDSCLLSPVSCLLVRGTTCALRRRVSLNAHRFFVRFP
jgi:hypothetical protein